MDKRKLYLYTKKSTSYKSHESHPVQPGAILILVRKNNPVESLYKGFTYGAKCIILSDQCVTPLTNYFSDPLSPTDEEVDMVNMLFGIDYHEKLDVVSEFLRKNGW